LISETGKKFGFLDMIKYEETHMTYLKCVDLVRVASATELEDLGNLPFHYGLTVKYWLSRVGGTSFQVNGEVYATESGKSIFRSSVVCVSVDKKTRKVTDHPKWWADKYREAASERSVKALRISLPKEYSADNLISHSSMFVQPLHLDYYGHANNSSYMMFAMNAVLSAQMEKRLPWTTKEVENSIKRLECDFISDCGVGDKLDMFVYIDPADANRLYVTLCNGETVIYVQMLQYDSPTGETSRL
jgi:acyl-CoA thioesterase FadM